MRFLILTLTALVSVSGFAFDEPTTIESSYEKVYMPQGFDSNDLVQIVAEGSFPSSCYKPGEVKVKVNHEKKTINISSTAYLYSGICLQVIVNYSKVIDLGLLKKGKYKVLQSSGTRLMGKLDIKAARTAEADEFLYAPINQAFIGRGTGKFKLILTGNFTNSCMDLEKVEVKNEGDVIVVQPIAYFESDDSCEDGSFPFRHEKLLNIDIPVGRYLLHVRSMNGKAINNLIDIR